MTKEETQVGVAGGARQRFNDFFIVVISYFSVLSLPFVLWIISMAQKFSTMQVEPAENDIPIYYPGWVDDNSNDSSMEEKKDDGSTKK
jgi:hypothetical protein